MAIEPRSDRSISELPKDRVERFHAQISDSARDGNVPWDRVERELAYGIEETGDGLELTESPTEPIGHINLYLEGEDEILGVFVNSIERENKVNKKRRNMRENIAKAYKAFSEHTDKEFRAVGFLYEDEAGDNFELLTYEDIVYEP